MEVQPIGAKHFSSSSTGVVQIVKPADNVSGVVIRTGVMSSGGYSILSAGTASPSDAFDFSKPILLMAGAAVTSQLQYPISLPAGRGLWMATSGNAGTVFVTYDLLP
ncbi:hypothetical protein [Pseudomonas neuropathica]|uniref:hypothetical protein n=1 Tax=Pseudomonas neuropathica TaxID=2730425 RepID=UPI003EBAE849